MKYFKTILIVSIVVGASNAEPNSEQDVGEFGEYFEGDMRLTDAQKLAVQKGIVTLNGPVDTNTRWPNNTVVYHINEDDFDEDQLKSIKDGMEDISNKTCIQFRERETDAEQAVIIQGSTSGCYSDVGYHSSGELLINYGTGCFSAGTIVHEMLHTLGFYHMQSTYDRDDFVTIQWDNIKEGKAHNFEKYTSIVVTDFGVPYDYGSVMHYPEWAFSKNGEATIVPKEEGAVIGQRVGLSDKDVLKVKKMYCETPEED